MSKKVLIVDDEPDARAFAASVLGDDFETAQAGSADDGLKKARAIKPDLMLLDVQMPGKDGFVLFDELGHDEALKNIPVVMLTGIAEKTGMKFSAEDMSQFIGRAPAAYLEKPIDPAALLKTVSGILG